MFHTPLIGSYDRPPTRAFSGFDANKLFMRRMKFLAVSGSLRAASSNTRLVESLPVLCPVGVEIVIYRDLGALPHFNPDLDGQALPEPVRRLRKSIGDTDGLILCSPEYAHGIAGVMKNALDWLVASFEFPETPVALINTAPRATHAIAQMREILITMQARIVEAASIAVPLQGQQAQAIDIIADPSLAEPIRAALAAFAEAIRVLPRTQWE